MGGSRDGRSPRRKGGRKGKGPREEGAERETADWGVGPRMIADMHGENKGEGRSYC